MSNEVITPSISFVPLREVSSGPSGYTNDGLPPPVLAIRFYLPLKIAANCENAGVFQYCCYLFPTHQAWPVGLCALDCPGHETMAAAREHYRQFLIERFGRYSGTLATPSVCSVCGRLTTHYAFIDYHYEWEVVSLCSQHLNVEGLSAGFVLRDYHLLQISDPNGLAAATIAESFSPVSVVVPRSRDSRF